MVSRDGWSKSLPQAESAPTADPGYSKTVENYLGPRGSTARKTRLDSICRRLQAEGSPVIIKDGAELPIMAFVKREGAANDVQDIGFVDFQELPAPPIDALVQVFDLSRAEARLAQKLARGKSLEEASQSLEIKLTTARSQLAAIFQKTRTRRQARLVALLSRLAHIHGLNADREPCRHAETCHGSACV